MASTPIVGRVTESEKEVPGNRLGAPGEPRRIAYLYILPAFAVYGVFLLFPLGRSVWLSLYRWDGLSVGKWIGLDNYADLIANQGLRAAFGHALVLVLFYAALPVVIGLLITAVMGRAKPRGMAFFRSVLFLPQVIALVVVAVAWRRIYQPDGSLNQLLGALGLGGLEAGWLGDYTFALPALGIVGTWVSTGLVIVLFLSGLGKIPNERYEAVRLDGAGPVREFFVVTLPALRNEISVALTLTVIAALRTFDLVFMTTRGGPGNSTSVPSYEVYHRAFETGQVGSAAAIGVSLTAIIFVLSFGITRVAERSR